MVKVFKAQFALSDNGKEHESEDGDKKIWISCGDHQWWHIEVFRKAIVRRHGEESVSEMRQDLDGIHYFWYSEGIDMDLIGRDVGVRHSSPSTSFNSSTASVEGGSEKEQVK